MDKIGFIGMGNMALALAGGFIKSQKVRAENIFAYAPNQEKLKKNADSLGFVPCDSLKVLVKNCDTLVVACKPYQIEGVLAEIKADLKEKTLISVAAGWTFDTFSPLLDKSTKILCIMPNTPAMVGEGVFLFEDKNSLSEAEYNQVTELFASLGIVETLPTRLMGIGGAVSGCGPAFMDLVMEAYADAAVKYGISRAQAYRLVAQTMKGSAALQIATGDHPGVLKDAVCSPGGTTICGVDALEKAGLRGACIGSIDAIMLKKSGK